MTGWLCCTFANVAIIVYAFLIACSYRILAAVFYCEFTCSKPISLHNLATVRLEHIAGLLASPALAPDYCSSHDSWTWTSDLVAQFWSCFLLRTQLSMSVLDMASIMKGLPPPSTCKLTIPRSFSSLIFFIHIERREWLRPCALLYSQHPFLALGSLRWCHVCLLRWEHTHNSSNFSIFWKVSYFGKV